MSDATHYHTAPEDRIPFVKKLIYGLGAFVNNTLAAAIGGMIIILNLGFGLSPALVGLLGALPRVTDAVTDPLMGYISDNTRSRWGRRRPYIFVGAISVGIIFALLWQMPRGYSDMFYFWWFLGGSIIFYLAYTIYATPWVALGYELTPDYHERTRLMGTQNFIGNVAYMISPYFLAIMYLPIFGNGEDGDPIAGSRYLALIIAVVVIAIGVLPAIFLRERFIGSDDENDTSGDDTRKADTHAGPISGSDPVVQRRYVGAEADYYVERWSTGGDNKSTNFGFNWAAFLLSVPWLLYRRMWPAFVAFVLVAGAVVVLLQRVTSYLDGSEMSAIASVIVSIFVRLFYIAPALALGFVANRLYYRKAVRAIGAAAQAGGNSHNTLDAIGQMGGTITRRWPGIENFFGGFAATLRFVPFRLLCIATFLVFNGFILIASFQPYVIIFYVFGGDESAGSIFAGHSGLVQAIAGLLVIMFVTWLATRIGKRRAFFVSTGISMVGYSLKWFCYTPDNPWLILIPAPLMAFGLAGLFTLMPSMICDVVDADELKTNKRREGMYGSIFWWVVKLGQSVAIAGGGVLLVWTGFDVELGGQQSAEAITLMRLSDAFIPAIASGIAIWAIASYSLSEERAHDVRMQLEARRGTA